jgi:ASC-1-like (ASCH) protein
MENQKSEKSFSELIREGLALVSQRLIAERIKEDGDFIIFEDGKVKKVKATQFAGKLNPSDSKSE